MQTKEIRDLRRRLRESNAVGGLPSLAAAAAWRSTAGEGVSDDDEEEEDDDEDDEEEKSWEELLEEDEGFAVVAGVLEGLLRRGRRALEFEEVEARREVGRVLSVQEVEERRRSNEGESGSESEESDEDEDEDEEGDQTRMGLGID